MGVLDMAKMIRKAQQTKGVMKKVTAAGRSRSQRTAILLNGLNDIEEIEFSEELMQNCDAKLLEREVIEAFKDAKKNLEKELAQTMDMDSIRDMLS